MSIRVMTAVFDYSEARGNDRLVLLVIADRSDDDGTGCWRGKQSIAHMARVSRGTVTNCLRRLELLGELKIDRRPGDTSEYRIVLPGVGQILADLEPEGSANRLADGRPTALPGVGQSVGRDTSLDVLEPSGGARAPSPKPSRIPDEFVVTDAMVEWAAEKCPSVDWDYQTEKFCDHWRSKGGKEATKLDWTAAWRLWMRRSAEGMR